MLSLVGLIAFWPLGILGYIFASTTGKRYRTGELPAYYRGLVTAGKVLGILCMVALGIFIVILATAVGLEMASR